MNRTFSLTGLLLGLALAAPLWAQSTPPPPTPPYLNPIPDNSQWLITATPPPPPSAPGAPVTLKSESITITGDIRRNLYTWSNGTQTETWFYQGAKLEQNPGNPEVYLDDSHYNSREDAAAPRNWDHLGWITASNYVRPVTEQGASCYEFTSTDAGGLRALVDVASRFPLLLEENHVTYRFEKQSAPVQKLTLPPKFAAKWNQYTANIKKLIVNRTAR